VDTTSTAARIKNLYEFGQSIWLDNISRAIIDNAELSELISVGVSGVTSNPTIFDKSISESSDYDVKIRELKENGLKTFEIYDALTVRDIQDAADLFLLVFNKTNARDGYVSLEVNPLLANKVEETVEEAERLYKKVDRLNVMFKVPATDEGLDAGIKLLSQGININFTLIFSLEQYTKTAKAFIKGAQELLRRKGNLSSISSVASVFVSRIDTSVDKLIDVKSASLSVDKKDAIQKLKGKAAVANVSLIFAKYLEIFSGKEFIALEKEGLKKQRALWASTSTKNPAYSDIKYVTELIAKDTINTVPQSTIDAFIDHGAVKSALSQDTTVAQTIFSSLESFGIDVNRICGDLLKDGVMAFQRSFNSLLRSIELKAEMIKI
jgi:transaldolase